MTQVTIVCGPPGSGKTTWVAKQMHWGDLVLDIDRMYEAICMQPMYEKPINLLPVILAMRDAVVAQLQRPNRVPQAFVITTTTRHDEIAAMANKLNARVVVMNTPSVTCMQRVAEDKRRGAKLSQWQSLIEKWFRDWRDYPGAEVVG